MTTINLELPTKINLAKFLSVHAHDLRTPYNHINGFSKMILNHLSDAPLTEFQREDLGTVYRSGMRALALTNGLIDIARLKRHETKFDPAELEIKQILEESLELWKRFNPGADVQVGCSILATSPTLQADEQIVRQIITGFTSYVAQFTEAKSKVSILVEEEADCFALTFTSEGSKSKQPSKLDVEMFGFLGRAFVELHTGKIRRAEENDSGAIIQFTLPKV